jgi:hypothetical protein
MITRSVTKEEQLIKCNHRLYRSKVLEISENVLKLIPPRPAGYDYNRELFNRRTGLSFDPLAAAEAAADIPLSFYLILIV